MNAYMSQVGRKNAEAVGSCIMLCVQYARNDDITIFMPSSNKYIAKELKKDFMCSLYLSHYLLSFYFFLRQNNTAR
jgi:hypothetical protein